MREAFRSIQGLLIKPQNFCSLDAIKNRKTILQCERLQKNSQKIKNFEKKNIEEKFSAKLCKKFEFLLNYAKNLNFC